jgi:hypothetical protein
MAHGGRAYFDIERLGLIADNRVRDRRNTVQPQAVNLADAEPCLNSRRGSFFIYRRALPAWMPSGNSAQGPRRRNLRGRAALPIESVERIRARAAPWPSFPNTQSRPRAVATRLDASTAPGPRRRPDSKVRTAYEDARCFSSVRILGNPDDSFEDAHRFRTCAREIEHLRRTLRRGRPVPRSDSHAVESLGIRGDGS